MAEGLQSFGGMPLGLLSQAQLGQLQSSYQPNQGQYNQALPADYKPLNPKPGDTYDPYYNLRMMMPGLLNNPNFSWLKSMDLQPMQNLKISSPVSANSTGGLLSQLGSGGQSVARSGDGYPISNPTVGQSAQLMSGDGMTTVDAYWDGTRWVPMSAA